MTIVGCLVLVGWAFDLAALKSVLPGLATMKANTALGFILAGVSLWLLGTEQANQRTRCIAQACAGIVALLGLLTLSEYLFGWDLGIDQLLIRDLQTDPEASKPGRMAPATALNFLMLGAALLLLDVETRHGHRLSEALTLLTVITSLLASIGYSYNAESLYGVHLYSSMALHTALTFIALSIGVLFARPDRELMAIITGDRPGSFTARRLLPAAVVIPMVLGWLRLEGQRAEVYGTEFGLALFATLNIIIFAALIWWSARSLNQTDTRRKQAEEALQARHEELQSLHEIGQTVLNCLDLQSTVEGILDKALSICSFDIGVIRLLDPRSKSLQPVASRGYRNPGDVNPHSIEAKDPTAGKIQTAALSSSGAYTVENVPATPGLRTLKREGAHTAILIPVRAENQVLGTILLASRTPRKFLPQEVRLLETLASQLGIAVQKTLLHEKTHQNLERIRALHEMDLAITSTLDLRTILDILLEKIDRLLPFVTATTVRLLNRETGKLEPVACRNLDEEEWKVATAAATASGLGRMLREKNTPVMVLNAQTDPRSLAPEFLRKYGLVSSLRVPLVAKDEVLGVLTFFTKEEHQFTDEEVEFLTTLGAQAAAAVHNSQLYEESVRASKVKDEFLSVMSHELRTPLNVVMGYTGMMKDGMLGGINPEQEKALEKILRQSRDQLVMVNQILQTTHIESGGGKIEVYEVAPTELLEGLKSDYELSSSEDLSLIWDYPSDLPIMRTDGTKLKQILQNLINNAIKFTPKGHIAISARHDPASETVEFKVEDTGVGIAKEFLPAIFEMFRQVDSSETRLYGGVGLGLYIVKRFSELLGGKVEAESDLGKGSTFTAKIPCEC